MYYYAFIFCDDFEAIRLGQMLELSFDKPVGVVKDKKISSLNEAARLAGLTVGMRLSEAQSLGTGATFDKYESDRDQQAQFDWLNTCLEFGNQIENCEPGCAYLDLLGQVDLVQTMELLTKEIFQRHGYRTRIGIAQARWIARAAVTSVDYRAVRLGLSPIPFVNDIKEQIRDFSVQTLPISPKSKSLLNDLGYENLESLQELPLSQLKSNFGQEALCIFWACKGQWHDPILPNYPYPEIYAETIFQGGTDDSSQLQEAMVLMSSQVAAKINQKGWVAQAATFTIECSEGTQRWIKIHWQKALSRASAISVALWLAFEKLNLNFSISKLGITLMNLKMGSQTQNALDLFSQQANSRIEFEDAARPIRNALGENAILMASQIELTRREKWLKEWQNATGWR